MTKQAKPRNKRSFSTLTKIIIALTAGAVLIVLFFSLTVKTISSAEADQICQDFYSDVQTKIKAQPEYTVIDKKLDCHPSVDEGGNTDYYFNAVFRLTAAGNETPEGIKSNIENFAKKFPVTDYPAWVRNDASVGGQPQTICFDASKQIQEDGEVYNSSPPKNYPDYTTPGSLPDYDPCYKLKESR